MFMIRNEAHSFMTAADVSIVPRFEPVNDAWMEKKSLFPLQVRLKEEFSLESE